MYQDTAGGPEQAVLVAGAARSGTTWLAEVLAAPRPTRIVFEPFNPTKVAAYRSFEYLQYAHPDQPHPALRTFVEEVLAGGLRDPRWVDRMVAVLRPEARVVKAVRATMMLRWIHDRFPSTPCVLILRHPCAVASSFARLGWSARPDLESILRQSALEEDHLRDVAGLIRSPLTPAEVVGAVWCVCHRVALRQCAHSRVVRVHYEDLVARPEEELARVCSEIGVDADDSMLAALRRPSRTAKGGSRRAEPPEGGPPRTGEPRRADRPWADLLAPTDVAGIQRILETFGLDHLYDGRGHPTGTLHQDP